jgi:hypothetical protein
LSEKTWDTISAPEKSKILGYLNSIGGWIESVRPSAKVKLISMMDDEDYIVGVGG